MEHPSSLQNIKVLAKKIKLVLEDGAEIKFSNLDAKVEQKDQIACPTYNENKEESKQNSDNTQATTQEIETERVRVYIN